jgi:transaldolase
MQDEGINAFEIIRESVGWLRTWGFRTKVIVGSMRGVGNVQEAILAGADIVTVPPKFLDAMIDHKYSRFTVAQFLADGSEAAAQTFMLDDNAEHAVVGSGSAAQA